MKTVSFIIPAYNAEKTIEKAITSILNQDDSDVEFEIIVVDDGSTDNTGNIVQKYKGIVRYIKKENGGVSSARNLGAKYARGDYYIFLDADDYISKNLLHDIQKYIEIGADLIKWSPYIVDNNGDKIYNKNNNVNDNINNKKNNLKDLFIKNKKSNKENITNQNKEEAIFTNGEGGFNILYGKDPLMCCVWNYAIDKNIFIPFPIGRYHEDFAVMPLIILNSKKMCITEHYEYYYVQTDSSIMRNNDEEKEKEKLQDILDCYDDLINKIEEYNISDETKENYKIFITNSLIVKLNDDLSKENKEYFIKELKKRNVIGNLKNRNIKEFFKKTYMTFYINYFS